MVGTTLERGAAEAIAGGWHGDAFGVLGPHKAAKGWEIRAFVPGAERLWILAGELKIAVERLFHEKQMLQEVLQPRRLGDGHPSCSKRFHGVILFVAIQRKGERRT